MNILMVTGKMDNGGAETHVYELARALKARGNEVTLVSAGGRLARALSAQGIRHVLLPTASRSPISIARSIKGLRKLTSERTFKVAHAHTRLGALEVSKVCQRSGIPLVTTVHARYRENILLDSLSRWGSSTIAVSYDLGQYLLSHSKDVMAENISVIPNGIDTRRFCSDGCQRSSRVVFASRLDADCSRAAYALVGIAERLYQSFPDVRIIICGGGREYKRILAKAKEVNGRIGKKLISAVGHVEDVSTLLKDAAVFVGVSRAALEAMSCETPVVLAGNEGFIGEVTEKNITLCESTNFCCRGESDVNGERLLDALISVLERPIEQREREGSALREYVLRFHSSEHMAEQTERVYGKALSAIRGEGGVLLCGYYGYGNMGDDAMLLRAIERAKQMYPALPICAMTARGSRDSEKFGVACYKRSHPLELMRRIRRSNVVVFGGGTLLQNSTSLRSLWYYLFILHYAHKRGKPSELWGNGIGRIDGRLSCRLTARSLAECRYVGLRDRESVIQASALISLCGVNMPNIVSEEDLAFKPFFAQRGRSDYIFSKLDIKKGDRFAVVALRGTEKRGYVKIMERWLHALYANGMRLIFVVMYPNEDLELTRRVCNDTCGTVVYPLGVSDVSELIRASTLVCSMRYHALVFSAAVGTPFMGFGGEEKVERFCRSNGGVYAGMWACEDAMGGTVGAASFRAEKNTQNNL